MESGPRYRIIKTKDHNSPWSEAFVVFDTARTDSAGLFEYVADCVDNRTAQLVADALNAHPPALARPPRKKRPRRAPAASAKQVAAKKKRTG